MRFLFVDRILDLVEGKSIRGIKNITLDEPFLTTQYTQIPSLYSAIVGETLGQLAAWNIMHNTGFKRRPVAGIFDSIKFYRPVFSGETMFLEANIDSCQENAASYHGKAYVGDELVVSINGALAPMLPMENFIDPSLVKIQFAHIYRPGELLPRETNYNLLGSVDISSLSSTSSSDVRFLDPADKPRDVGSARVITNIDSCFQFDYLISCTDDQEIIASKLISFSAPYFSDHFPNKPVLPLSVLLECVHNLSVFLLDKSQLTGFRLSEISKIKIRDFIQPGDYIICHLKLKSHDDNHVKLQATITLENRKIAIFVFAFN